MRGVRAWANGTFGLGNSYTSPRCGDFGAFAPYFSTHPVLPAPPVQGTGYHDHRDGIGHATLLLRGDVPFISVHNGGCHRTKLMPDSRHIRRTSVGVLRPACRAQMSSASRSGNTIGCRPTP